LQAFLDDFLKLNPKADIDYIHEKETVLHESKTAKNIGFLLPAMNKYDLFPSVIENGVLPRKTFSMGEGKEKKFYMECKKIIA
jgi:hypothetical protein